MHALLTIPSLRLHALLYAGVSAVLLLVWALTTRAYFWPQDALLPLALVLAIHVWLVLVSARPGIRGRTGGSRLLAAQLGISAVLSAYLVVIWARAPGYFWPGWALLGLAIAAGGHALVVRSRQRANP